MFGRFQRPAALVTLAVSGAACRPEPAGAPAGEPRPAPTVEAATSQEPASDSLVLELAVPPQVRLRQPVPVRLSVRNPTGRTLDLYLRGRAATLDVVVERADGAGVWRRLENEVIPAIVHLRVLAPGDGFDVTTTWDQRTRGGSPMEPGEYSARGFLLAERGAFESPPVRFRVVTP